MSMLDDLKIKILLFSFKMNGIKMTIEKDSTDGKEIVVLTMQRPKNDKQKFFQDNVLKATEKKIKRQCDTEAGELIVVFNAPMNKQEGIDYVA